MERFNTGENQGLVAPRRRFSHRRTSNQITVTLRYIWTAGRVLARRFGNYLSANAKLQFILYTLAGLLCCLAVYALAHLTYAFMISIHSRPAFSYVSLSGFGIQGASYSTTTSDRRGQCLARCKKSLVCSTVMFDPTLERKCHLFQHTPFYHDLKPFPKNESTIYINYDDLSHVQHKEGGYNYYVTSLADKISNVEQECRISAEFFHLAVDTVETNALKVAKTLYSKLADSKGHDSKIILKQATAAGKNYVSVGQTVEFDVNHTTVGYGLCQGDPFNRAGNASFFRDILLNEEVEEQVEKAKLFVEFLNGNYENP